MTESKTQYEIGHRRYKFDGETYTFAINGELIEFPKLMWEAIATDYSADGGNLNRQEIAAKYGISKPILDAALRRYEQYKASPPATREEIADANGEFDPLMERAVEVAGQRLQGKLHSFKLRHLQKENEQLKSELHSRGTVVDEFRAILTDIAAEFPKAGPVEKLLLPDPEYFDFVGAIYDAHIGLVWHGDRKWSHPYNSSIAATYIRAHGQASAAKIRARPGRCQNAYLPYGGDMLHSVLGKTVHGRIVGADKKDRELMRIAYGACLDQIEAVRPVAEKVWVGGIGGNHDAPLAEILIDMIGYHYSDTAAADVTVDTTNAKQAYFLAGDTLHVFDHGEAFGNVTTNNSLAIAERIARNVAGEDFYKARRIIFYVGHMHHRESARSTAEKRPKKKPNLQSLNKSQGHIEIIRVPVFCHENDYEEMLGFWNEPMADLYFLNPQGKIAGIERLYMQDITKE